MMKIIIWDATAVPLGILISAILYKSLANWYGGVLTAETKYASENILLTCLCVAIICVFTRYATPSSQVILGASGTISFVAIYVKLLINYTKSKKS